MVEIGKRAGRPAPQAWCRQRGRGKTAGGSWIRRCLGKQQKGRMPDEPAQAHRQALAYRQLLHCLTICVLWLLQPPSGSFFVFGFCYLDQLGEPGTKYCIPGITAEAGVGRSGAAVWPEKEKAGWDEAEGCEAGRATRPHKWPPAARAGRCLSSVLLYLMRRAVDPLLGKRLRF